MVSKVKHVLDVHIVQGGHRKKWNKHVLRFMLVCSTFVCAILCIAVNHAQSVYSCSCRIRWVPQTDVLSCRLARNLPRTW